MESRMVTWARWSAASLLVMCLFVLVGGATNDRLGAVTAREAQAAPASTLAPDRLSVVLILTDDQSTEAVAQMPYLSSRGDWHTFTHAFVNNSLCCPARATTLSGQYDTRHGVVHNAVAKRFNESQTLGVWLQQAGYRTGLFGKYFNGYPSVFGKGETYVPPGWDDWRVSFTNMLAQFNYSMNENGVVKKYGDAEADYLVDVLRRRIVEFIGSSPADQPFFVLFTPTSTHSPWRAAPRHAGRFNGVTMPRYPNSNEADVSDKPAWVRALPRLDMTVQDNNRRRAWRAALGVDDALREIDAALKSAGRLDDTVVIYTSDNGLTFGAHRWTDKRCEFEECHHVPLLVRYPGQPGSVDGRLVSNVDLAATVVDLADAAPGITQDGKSLVPLLTGAAVSGWRTGILQHWPGGDQQGRTTNRPVPASYGIRTRDFRYVELATGERELYDLRNDPYELQNVATNAAYASVRADLDARLDVLIAQSR